MVFHSSVNLEVSGLDVVSWTFAQEALDESQPILVDADAPHRTISRAEFRILVRKLTAGLHNLGLRKGHCIIVYSRNDIFLAPFAYACFASGIIFCPVSFLETAERLIEILRVSAASWIAIEPDNEQLLRGLIASAGFTGDRVISLGYPGRVYHSSHELLEGSTLFESLLTTGERDWIAFNDTSRATSETIIYGLTSGSTGLPKIAKLPHTSLTHTVSGRRAFFGGQGTNKFRFLHSIPLFHVTGWYLVTQVVAASGMLCLSRSTETSIFVSQCTELGITHCYMTPKAMLEACILIETERLPLSSLESLIEIAGVGAPIQSGTVGRLKAIAGTRLRVIPAYGSTETAGLATFPHDVEPPLDDPFPLGMTFPNVELKIIEPSSKAQIQDFDTPGEFLVRTPSLFTGYLNDEAATNEVMINDENGRWFRTGDVGYISKKNHFWYIIGRAREVFKLATGESIAPLGIEGVLQTHPGIADAAVGPIINPSGDNETRFWIQRQDPALERENVTNFLKGKIAQHQMPAAGIIFVDQLPRNAAGKLLRSKLLDLHEV